jgi:hypothetical protein
MSKGKLARIIAVCTVAIIVAVLLFHFAPWKQRYTLSVDINPPQAGSVSPAGGEYESDVMVTLTANPANGYRFVYWTGNVSTIDDVNAATTTITMNDNYSITANFEEEAAPPEVVDTAVIIQEGNDLSKTQLQTKRSPELEDNHISVGLGTYYKAGVPIPSPFHFDSYGDDPELVYSLGFKWMRISFDDFCGDPLDWQNVEIESGNYSIKPEVIVSDNHKLSGLTYPATHPSIDEVISDYAGTGINIILNLGVGTGENRPDSTRFEAEKDVENYCNWVRFMVRHFKDRIRYYEIWNEPDSDFAGGNITWENYVKLVKRAAYVIREESPEAKIVVGGTSNLMNPYSHDYLFSILGSDIMPVVDAICWHPMYGTSPGDDCSREYYYDYPSIVREIKNVASAHGFGGEYIAEELHWKTYSSPFEPEEPFSEPLAGKYYARAIVMHRGLNVTVSIVLRASCLFDIIPNLCTVMAGAAPINLPREIQSEVADIMSYSFSLSNGDKLLVLWTDGVAVVDDPGIEATVTLASFSAQKVVGIDVLNGFEQELITGNQNGTLVIEKLLVKDYPIILRLSR